MPRGARRTLGGLSVFLSSLSLPRAALPCWNPANWAAEAHGRSPCFRAANGVAVVVAYYYFAGRKPTHDSPRRPSRGPGSAGSTSGHQHSWTEEELAARACITALVGAGRVGTLCVCVCVCIYVWWDPIGENAPPPPSLLIPRAETMSTRKET